MAVNAHPGEGRRIAIRGIVQGVGFRPWVYRLARRTGVAGRVRNDASGVTIEAFGSHEALDVFLHDLKATPPPAAKIRELSWESIPPESASEFSIVASEQTADRRVSIPPDLATCDECAAEIFDPKNRRYRYPFTNCTNCGPRFTITKDVPYDRPATTMARFPMCADCKREYEAVSDRRFHAQPNACPQCGPKLTVVGRDGQVVRPPNERDEVSMIADALLEGRIVAIKGIGGFHLACDATSPAAVRLLRARKRRDEKPFAVMVRTIAQAAAIAEMTGMERELLASVERPIVLLPRRPESGLAPEVAPDNPLVGLMLAYSPLHHLLLADVGRPLVMTSGNLSDEPIAYRDGEAIERLGAIADLIAVHDREIETRCDDSVARVIAGRPAVLRRSRGWVPRAIATPTTFREPVLAVGAQLKNTFCFGVGDSAFLGPHVGDLDNLSVLESFEASIERMGRFLKVKPAVISHDLHPDYPSTRWALEQRGVRAIGVQHHHAHVASAMVEHGLTGPVLGLAFDGTGYGNDGTAWGGEFLLADFDGFERIATFRPLKLAGGDRAIREIWRIGLAALIDALGPSAPLDAFPGLARVAPADRELVSRMLERGVNSPRAHGLGRWFDAFASLFLGRNEARFEGQAAMAWDWIADPGENRAYPWAVNRSSEPWSIDLRPALEVAVAELLAGREARVISARFHNTLMAACAEVVRDAVDRVGKVPVVLTGGCFQNVRLAEGILAELSSSLPVYLHSQVPTGDGGISLGQAAIAGSIARRVS